MYDQKEVGKRLMEVRRKKELSRKIVAEQLGYSEDTVIKAEQGRHISLNYVTAFAELYSVSLDYIFMGVSKKSCDKNQNDDEFVVSLINISENKRHLARTVIENIIKSFVQE